MTTRKACSIPSILLILAAVAGCGGFGKVNQGRVIHYDRQRGLLTLIQDSNSSNPANPRYDLLPPVTIRIPNDSRQMGPAPEAGKLMALDSDGKRIVIFDERSRSLRTIRYELIREEKGVARDDRRVTGNVLPAVDRRNKTITVYLPKLRRLSTFAVPDEFLELPDDTWKAGDEVRYYYKNPSQALRLMNVTRTNIG